MTLEAFLRRVVAIVDDSGISYMITGSIAVAYYAEPRATRDIDVVIAVSREQIGALLRRLDDEGHVRDQCSDLRADRLEREDQVDRRSTRWHDCGHRDLCRR